MFQKYKFVGCKNVERKTQKYPKIRVGAGKENITFKMLQTLKRKK
jgi:hypothetical protein